MLDFSIPRKYRALIDADRLTFAFQKSVEMLGLSPQTSAALKISDDASIRKLNKAYRGLDEATEADTIARSLDRLRALCRRYGMMEISGEDINSPRQSFVIKRMEDEQFHNLIHSTWELIKHENGGTLP